MNTNENWKVEVDEIVRNLIRLIQAETVNPPGNEEPAIRVVKEILEKAGFPAGQIKIVESAPGRVNLVARLKGDGSQRPLLLSGHVDVVPVERDKWSRDPFGGEVIDGVVWGRGALDMKGFLAIYLQVFLMAFRQKLPMKRDLILAAIADEEAGMIHGSRFLVEQHRDLIDAEYGMTEGGAMTVHFGKVRVYPIQVAEKQVCWLRMRTAGEPGHGSMPHSDHAVLHLATALERMRRAGHLPIHLTPTYLGMMHTLGAQLPFPMNLLTTALRYPALVGLLLRRVPPRQRGLLVALVSNSVSPNMLQAGAKINVIPSTAEVALDCRLLPGQTPEGVMDEIRAIIDAGNHGLKVEFEVVYTLGGAEFPTDTPLYRLMDAAARRMDPGGLVTPFMMPGATDACQYKKAGIKIYGFTPGMLSADFPILKMAHGHDERVPISYFESGLPALWGVVREFCAG
jgi:acetylornithine deacetylase/succinyl-diaminopimelate desuccinylase-like protein